MGFSIHSAEPTGRPAPHQTHRIQPIVLRLGVQFDLALEEIAVVRPDGGPLPRPLADPQAGGFRFEFRGRGHGGVLLGVALAHAPDHGADDVQGGGGGFRSVCDLLGAVERVGGEGMGGADAEGGHGEGRGAAPDGGGGRHGSRVDAKELVPT